MGNFFKELIMLILKNWYMSQYASWIHYKYQLNDIDKIKPALDLMHRRLFGCGLDD